MVGSMIEAVKGRRTESLLMIASAALEAEVRKDCLNLAHRRLFLCREHAICARVWDDFRADTDACALRIDAPGRFDNTCQNGGFAG